MVENAEAISAHPDRIKDQLAEVKVNHHITKALVLQYSLSVTKLRGVFAS